MKTEIINPNLDNFIKSLRDVGYTFEIAVADILDNSISAEANEIKIFTVATPQEIIFCLLDNGIGMSESELIEAMRLSSRDPDETRALKDLGRFGLGLKTASFSQCKKLTVLSKKNNLVSIKQWDLDYISSQNQWLLITPNITNFPFVEELDKLDSGTLVIWQDIDRYNEKTFPSHIIKLRKHLSLVFHRFLSGNNSVNIFVNNNRLLPFDPFNIDNEATKRISTEKIKIYDNDINITPYILPHYNKTSQQEWEEYSTDEGYVKSQGFYLYRGNRLLIHGTWWGLHKAIDAHKLIRIKIDISNKQDKYWGIDIKKSTANPIPEIRDDLKRIISEVIKEGVKPFIRRGREIKDNTTTRFWHMIFLTNGDFRFELNKEHPLYLDVISLIPKEKLNLIDIYIKGLEAYLPLESIQANLQQKPHQLKQEIALDKKDIELLVKELKAHGLTPEYIEALLKTELFKNNREILENA